MSPRRAFDEPTTRQRVIETLRAASSNEPGIELLVLFGSVARGEDHPASDVDLLLDGPSARDVDALTRLRGSLSEDLGRSIGLLTLSEGMHVAPVLAGALRDGIVVTDRCDRWASVLEMRGEVEQTAAAEIENYPARRVAALARLSRSLA